MQRSDQAKVRCLIISANFGVCVLAIQENDRSPGTAAEPSVDALGLLLHFAHQILVALDVRPARRADLDKRQIPLIRRILIQQPFDPPKALEDTLRIIDPVYSQSEKARLNPQISE